MTIDISSIFSEIYKKDQWTNGSGPGSIPYFNRPLFEFISNFVKNIHTKSIVDVGCGDFQLFRNFDFGTCSYLGLDVVAEIVTDNVQNFTRESVRFGEMPQNLADLPVADLYVLKDVLIHLGNSQSTGLVTHILSKCRFAIIVNNTAHEPKDYNCEVVTGGFRPVDISRAPFNLPVLKTVRYGRDWYYDPRLPRLLAVLLRRRVWPGEKHIQLIAGVRQV